MKSFFVLWVEERKNKRILADSLKVNFVEKVALLANDFNVLLECSLPARKYSNTLKELQAIKGNRKVISLPVEKTILFNNNTKKASNFVAIRWPKEKSGRKLNGIIKTSNATRAFKVSGIFNYLVEFEQENTVQFTKFLRKLYNLDTEFVEPLFEITKR